MKCKWNNTVCISANYNQIDWSRPLAQQSFAIDILGCKYRREEIAHQFPMEDFARLTGNLYDIVKEYYHVMPNHDYNVYHHCQSLDSTCNWEGEEVKRIRISIERACNLHCVMCGASEGFSPILYKLHKLQYQAMNMLLGYNNNLDQITLTSDGEPFVYKTAFFEWLNRVTINDTKEVYMFSNLTLLTMDDIEAMHDYVQRSGVRVKIIASIDGITEPVYKAVRRNDHFEQVMANALKLKEYDILERVNFCTTRENICELNHVKDFWSEHNVFVDVILLDDFRRPGEREEILNSPEWKNFIIQEFK